MPCVDNIRAEAGVNVLHIFPSISFLLIFTVHPLRRTSLRKRSGTYLPKYLRIPNALRLNGRNPQGAERTLFSACFTRFATGDAPPSRQREPPVASRRASPQTGTRGQASRHNEHRNQTPFTRASSARSSSTVSISHTSSRVHSLMYTSHSCGWYFSMISSQ